MNADHRFEILAPQDPSIAVESVDPRTHVTFKRLFERPQLQRYANDVDTFANYCLVLTNRSSQRITALTVCWKYPNPTLRGPSGATNLTDAYNRGNDSGQVLLPGRQSLVYPTGSFRADALDVEHPIYFGAEGGMNGLRAIDMIRAAPLVTVSIDVIIFEDGRIIGPDDSQTVNRITERKRAAEDFVALVNRAIDEGLNVEEVLNGICTTTPQNSRDFYNSSLHRFARTLTRRPGIDPRLAVAQFANLPPLPKFWRAGENPEFT